MMHTPNNNLGPNHYQYFSVRSAIFNKLRMSDMSDMRGKFGFGKKFLAR